MRNMNKRKVGRGGEGQVPLQVVNLNRASTGTLAPAESSDNAVFQPHFLTAHNMYSARQMYHLSTLTFVVISGKDASIDQESLQC